MKKQALNKAEIAEEKAAAIQIFKRLHVLNFGAIYGDQLALIDEDFNFARDCRIWQKVFDGFEGVSIAQGKKPSFKHLFKVYRDYEAKQDKRGLMCDLCDNTGYVRVVIIEGTNNGIKRYVFDWQKKGGKESDHFGFIRRFANSERNISKFYGEREVMNCTCDLGNDLNTITDEDGNKIELHSMQQRQWAVQRRVPTVRYANEIIRKIKYINEGRENDFVFQKEEELDEKSMKKLKSTARRIK